MTSPGKVDAIRVVRDRYGIDSQAYSLASEWGGTFRIEATNGANYVLKIAPGHVGAERTEMEIAALQHMQNQYSGLAIQEIVKTTGGELAVDTDFGTARLYTWLDGRIWRDVKPHSRLLLRSLGKALGKLKKGLEGFDHPAAHHEFTWAPHKPTWVENSSSQFPGTKAALINRVLGIFREYEPKIGQLPASVNYNDANDYNIIVSHDLPETQVTGFIDFGDLIYGPRINDLAICLAYAMMGFPDPVGAGAEVVQGYHEEYGIDESEFEVLIPLVMSRLAISVTHAALRKAEDPENDYWQVSAEPAWALLEKLVSMPLYLALCRFREACNLEPSPKGSAVRQWLEHNMGTFHPVAGIDLSSEPVSVFDWSVGSLELGGLHEFDDIQEQTRRIFSRLKAEGAIAGIGRYDEPRVVYTSGGFEMPGNDRPEMRTIHIGLDIFMPAGTPLYAPLDGIVHTIVNNDRPKEYGPMLILEHHVDDVNLVFYTLYGHNSIRSLGMLKKGDRVKAGDRIAEIGDFPENGDWVPHLHFQVITDLLGYVNDYPGVAPLSQRKVWLSLCPDPNLLIGMRNDRLQMRETPVDKVVARRNRVMGANLSLSYRSPLHIVRGWKARLYDRNGTSYLDTVNNIAHVGHAHPSVVDAGNRQAAVLNTNTRYLHENLLGLAERLLATLPDRINRIYFVNSGSEANDLALRIARNATGSRETLVMHEGYHGITQSCIEVSPHKFLGHGGRGAAPYIHILPMPMGAPDADIVRAARKIATDMPANAIFLHETLPSCAGQVVPPQGYFSTIYDVIRSKSGICIADEVQTGIGRVGEAYWAFELYGIEPDIVTIGKPLGNGHPVAAVALTEELARSFNNGMEFFSSFGGNPVSCAIALEVLNVIDGEGLQAHAKSAGDLWKSHLLKLKSEFPIIHDVRGFGLFIGIELNDVQTGEPATTKARYIQDRMLEKGVLISLDGPGQNVVKIKPPMCISTAQIEYFSNCLENILGEDFVQ